MSFRLPRWNQKMFVDGADVDYIVIDVPVDQIEGWLSALNYTEYENRDWIRRGDWVVGCPPGLAYRCPSFEGIEAPKWAYDNV